MAESKRKFYKHRIVVEYLSDRPMPPDGLNLSEVDYETDQGECVGDIRREVVNEEISAKECARLLLAYGSQPDFFMLNEEGEDSPDLYGDWPDSQAP